MALIFRPYRVIPFSFISDTTKIISLEYAGEGDSGVKTFLREWTRHLEPEKIGPGPEPKRDQFYNKVLELLRGQ